MSKLKSFLILKALLLPLFSVIASDQPQAKENERYSWPPGEAVTLSVDIEDLIDLANREVFLKTDNARLQNYIPQVELGRYFYNKDGSEAFKWFKKASEKMENDPFGAAEAYKGLGWCYKDGQGVEKDEAEAEKYFRKASELEFNTRNAAVSGDAKAQVRLAENYDEIGNHTKAFKWFKIASENKDSNLIWVADAHMGLSFCYSEGKGVKKDIAEANKLFKKSRDFRYSAYHKRAEEGDAEAQYAFGKFLAQYEMALPLNEAKAEAAKWFIKSAEQGFADAQYIVGWFYMNGDGAPKDETEAFKWFCKAAEQGHAESQLKLGHCYANGEGVPEDETEAFKWYRKAAQQGLADAQNILGDSYRTGEGLPKDEAEAIKWYRMGADQGDAGSQFDLGKCYAQGIGVHKNNSEALKWLYKAAKRNKYMAFSFGQDYYHGHDVEKNLAEAVKFFLISAERGYDDAQFRLGVCYENGEGVPQDETEAVKWYKKAAEQKNADAQRKLGESYDFGKGVQKDKSEAEKWYRKAAEQGIAKANFNIEQNPLKARSEKAKWSLKAAEMGFADAQYAIARSYFYGDGVPEDKTEAEKWFRKAADQGNQEAKDALEKLLKDKQPKLALLIANSNYSHLGGLARTIPDAKALANVLNSMGFEVYLLKDGSREQILDALKSFENKVRGTNALAFFHFGGHGIQVEGKNYLIPADAEIPDERRVTTRAVDLDEVIASLESAKPKASVLVVDACRHNPLPATATRSALRGLAVVGRKPKNSVIIFAAEAGNEALDGLFTPVFAKALSENRDKSLNQIMQKVRSEVFNRSNGTQTPGEYNQLFDDVYLYKAN